MLKIFSIFDSKVSAYSQPHFFRSRGEALRVFSELANDKTCNIGKYPADFTIFDIGQYDELTAKFDLLPTPISCGVAVEFVGVGVPSTMDLSNLGNVLSDGIN